MPTAPCRRRSSAAATSPAPQFTTEISASFERSLTSIDFIVVVLIVSAAALAFVVLYNLTNINITEREKEIATIKVLGFYDREVSSYIYRETSVLTVIGILAGLAFGVALHQFVIRTAEIDMVIYLAAPSTRPAICGRRC